MASKKIKENSNKTRELEDYEPGASRAEIFGALKKVAKSPKPSQKRDEPPEPTS